MRLLLEESWFCSKQVKKLTLTGGKSGGSTPETAVRKGKDERSENATASGCVEIEGADDTTPSGCTRFLLKIESLVDSIHVPETSLCVYDKVQTGPIENEVQIISLAPPEKWSDPDFDFMEDGEISCIEDKISCDVVVTGDKRLHEEDPKLPYLKRTKFMDLNLGDFTCCKPSSKAEVARSRVDYNLAKSSTGQVVASSLESGSNEGDSSQHKFTLVPSLQSIIEGQRNKIAELEGEKNLLKSLFAKTLTEKNETLELLQKSNQALKKVTSSSEQMAIEFKALIAQLAEKNSQIKNLRTDAFTIRDCVSRMDRAFLKIQATDSQPPGRCNGEDNPKTRDRHRKQDSNQNYGEKNGTKSGTVSRNPSSHNQDQNDQRGKTKTSMMFPLKPTNSRRNLTYKEVYYILRKFPDLNKWKYSIRDIRWVDGEYQCPECGSVKKSLEAVAAHARDNHVWKHHGDFKLNRDRR